MYGGKMAGIGKVREQTKRFLRPDEEVQAALLAASHPSTNDHAIIVTNQRIMVFALTFTGRVKGLIADVDRNTPLGPFDDIFWSETRNLPIPLWIAWPFKDEVEEADSFLPEGLRPSVRPESKNRNARADRKIKRTRDGANWLADADVDGEVGLIVIIAAFVFTHPVRIFRLIRLTFKVTGTRHYGRATAALALNLFGWLAAIGAGYLAVQLFIWSHG
jgi:hypothetical protein